MHAIVTPKWDLTGWEDEVMPPVLMALAACEKAYESPDWDHSHTVIEEPATGAYALLSETPGFNVLAFRGTNELKDWKVNLRAIPPWRYGGAWVHRGFMNAHESIWHQVRQQLAQRDTRKRLLVTGHSLGGAMAELSCMFLRTYPGGVSLVKFASPNVFLKPRAARLQFLELQLSVTHGADLVARVPSIGYGPDLGQMLLYLANDGGVHYGSMSHQPEFAEFVDRDCNLFDFARNGKDHHSILQYRSRIDAFMRAEA